MDIKTARREADTQKVDPVCADALAEFADMAPLVVPHRIDWVIAAGHASYLDGNPGRTVDREQVDLTTKKLDVASNHAQTSVVEKPGRDSLPDGSKAGADA